MHTIRTKATVASFRPSAAMLVAALVLSASGLLIAAPTPSHASTVTDVVDGITYVGEPSTLTAKATDYKRGYGTVLEIPSSVTLGDGQTYTVTSIGYTAFAGHGLTKVTIPGTITEMESGAFMHNEITDVIVHSPVTTISYAAFVRNKITSISLPDSITTIEPYAFNQNELTAFTIPPKVTTLEEGVLGHNNLTELTIPDGITSIGSGAVVTNKLKSVTFPKSLGSIGSWAFSSNELTSVIIPGSVTSIGESAFARSPLTSVTFEGTAPPVFTPGSPLDDSRGSLGVNDRGVVVYYHKRFGDEADGFVSPMWQQYPSRAIVSLTFDALQGSAVAPLTLLEGENASEPLPPQRPGYTFTGWFTNATATNPFHFDTPVTDDVTLYAGWKENSVTPEPEHPSEPEKEPESESESDKDPSPAEKPSPEKGTIPPSAGEPSNRIDTLSSTGKSSDGWWSMAGLALLLAGAGALTARRWAQTNK